MNSLKKAFQVRMNEQRSYLDLEPNISYATSTKHITTDTIRSKPVVSKPIRGSAFRSITSQWPHFLKSDTDCDSSELRPFPKLTTSCYYNFLYGWNAQGLLS